MLTDNTYTNGKVTRQLDSMGAEWVFGYGTDTNGAPLTTVTVKRGTTVVDVWKHHYRRDGTIQWKERNGAFVDYTTFGNSVAPSARVDATGRTTQIETNAAGLPTLIKPLRVTSTGLVTPVAPPTTVVYDAQNRPTAYTANGVNTTLTYNAIGNPTTVVEGGQLTT